VGGSRTLVRKAFVRQEELWASGNWGGKKPGIRTDRGSRLRGLLGRWGEKLVTRPADENDLGYGSREGGGGGKKIWRTPGTSLLKKKTGNARQGGGVSVTN